MPTTSHGLLLLDESGRVFLAHATGTAHWDIPKGGAEPGESPLEAALRETREETGLEAADWSLQDLGEMAYRPGKRLHLFAARVSSADVDPAACRCSSFFPHRRTGRPVPEADAYAWVARDAWAAHVPPNLLRVLEACVPRVG